VEPEPQLRSTRDGPPIRDQVEVDPPQADRHQDAQQPDQDVTGLQRRRLREAGYRPNDHLAQDDDDEEAEPLDQRRRRGDHRIAGLGFGGRPPVERDDLPDELDREP